MKIHLVLLVFLLLVSMASCSQKNTAALEGQVFGPLNHPLKHVTVTAQQVEPLKGYESFSSTTDSNGKFILRGLYTQSDYVLSLSHQEWNTPFSMPIKTGPSGQTRILQTPLLVSEAFNDQGIMVDPRTAGPLASQLAGILRDAQNRTLPNVAIVASQVRPMRGYERVEATTNGEGQFQMNLLPSSEFVLSFHHKSWRTERTQSVLSPSIDQTKELRPIIFERVIREDGILVNPTTGDLLLTTLTGLVVDGKGRPLQQVTVVADQVEKLKGYERFEVLTDDEGNFQVALLALAEYVLGFSSKGWTTTTIHRVRAGAEGQTIAVLSSPVAIRYTRSPKGIVYDSQTDLEWYVAAAGRIPWDKASEAVADANWRLPSCSELVTLYDSEKASDNPSWINPILGDTGNAPWSSEKDAELSKKYGQNWYKSVCFLNDNKGARVDSHPGFNPPSGGCVFAVRTRSTGSADSATSVY